jgi:nitrogen fixation NifU-like protein
MFDELTDLYQQVILDHSRSPRNFRTLDPVDRQAEGTNPLCGDQISLHLQMDGDRIKDVGFQGSGCAISKASASIMTECLKGRTVEEVKTMFERVHHMVTTGQQDGQDLGKLAVFTGVHKFPARVKCAMLPWHAVLAALEGNNTPVTTE